jgi:hypothetical protein
MITPARRGMPAGVLASAGPVGQVHALSADASSQPHQQTGLSHGHFDKQAEFS